MEFSPDVELALSAAKNAADVIKNAYQKSHTLEYKDEYNNYATETDTAAEEEIIETLRSKSDYKILAEESGIDDVGSSKMWVIDPIDGTGNFARGIDFFCVSIALMERENIIAGVIVNPVNGDIFVAEKGKGAYKNGVQISVSGVKDSKRAVLFINRGYGDESKRLFPLIINKLGNHSVRKMGTSALEMCQVACGAADVFIVHGDQLWDVAAGICILQEAGGKVSNWKGDAWDSNNDYLMASNENLHDYFVQQIQEFQSLSCGSDS